MNVMGSLFNYQKARYIHTDMVVCNCPVIGGGPIVTQLVYCKKYLWSCDCKLYNFVMAFLKNVGSSNKSYES